MNIFQKIEYRRRLKWLVKETVSVLGVSANEAERRVLRVSGMEWLKEDLGGPESKEYQTAVDIIMQIPSDRPVTLEALKEVTDRLKKEEPKL